MTFDEFRQETSNLEQFFEKNYNPVQMKMWYEELRDYPLNRYKLAVRKVCKTSQYKPTLSTMLEAIRTVSTSEQVRQTTECKACRGTGFVLYKKIVEGREYEYASLCNCPNAIGRDYDGRTIADKEHRSLYYIPKAIDIFGLGGTNEQNNEFIQQKI